MKRYISLALILGVLFTLIQPVAAIERDYTENLLLVTPIHFTSGQQR